MAPIIIGARWGSDDDLYRRFLERGWYGPDEYRRFVMNDWEDRMADPRRPYGHLSSAQLQELLGQQLRTGTRLTADAAINEAYMRGMPASEVARKVGVKPDQDNALLQGTAYTGAVPDTRQHTGYNSSSAKSPWLSGPVFTSYGTSTTANAQTLTTNTRYDPLTGTTRAVASTSYKASFFEPDPPGPAKRTPARKGAWDSPDIAWLRQRVAEVSWTPS